MEKREVCKGAVEEMGDVLVPVLLESTLSPKYFCSRMVGFCFNPKFRTLKSADYVRDQLASKPEEIKNNDFHDNLYKEIAEDSKKRETIKILHMSDPHLDFEYVEGMNADCGKPVCCRKEDGIPEDPTNAAPKFGHPNCDTPEITSESAFEYLKTLPEEEQPDMAFWTGDNTPHDVWKQSPEVNALYTVKITEWLE